jgi:hypothetical protein
MTSKKKGRGRPRKSSGQAKSEGVLLRMEPSEKQGFSEAASVAGVPLAVWMRERLRLAAMRELEAADRPIPFLPPSRDSQGRARARSGPLEENNE